MKEKQQRILEYVGMQNILYYMGLFLSRKADACITVIKMI